MPRPASAQRVLLTAPSPDLFAPAFSAQTMSIDFDGADERLANTTDQAIGVANLWSLVVWVKPTVPIVGTQVLLGIRRLDLGVESLIQINHRVTSDRLRLSWADTSGTPTQISEWDNFFTGENGAWVNIIVAWTGTVLFVLKNGVDQGAPDVGVNNPSLTMVDDTRTIGLGNLSTSTSGLDGRVAQAAIFNADVRAAASVLNTSPSALDLNAPSGAYTFEGNLAHWYRPGHEASPNLGKDFAEAGITPTIDIEVNAEGITDADRVADVPT